MKERTHSNNAKQILQKKVKVWKSTLQKALGFSSQNGMLNRMEILCFLILLIQFGILCYINLRDVRISMDHDMANGFYHIKEIIRNRTVNIPDWHNTTSLELDTTFLFAIPIYYVVRDLFLASGISSILYILLYIVVIFGILHCAKVPRTVIFMTLTLVITPYTFGMLEYVNMLFFGVSWYVVKVITPLLLVWLLQLLSLWDSFDQKKKIGTGIVAAIYFVMLFTTTFSTGVYTLVSGIFPIILCLIFDIWQSGSIKGKYNIKHLALMISNFVVFVIGYKMYNHIFTDTSRAEMQLTKLDNYAVNLRACVAGIFQLFGAITTEDISAMSFDGMVQCVKFAIVLVFLIAVIFNIPRLFKKTEDVDCSKYLTALFVFDFFILVISDTRYSTNTTMEYRYYLIGAVPMIVLAGRQVALWLSEKNNFQKVSAYGVLAIALIMLLIGNNKSLMKQWDRSSYAVDMCDYFKTLDVESIFFIDDDKLSNVCRSMDDDHKYGTFMTESQTLKLSYCSYNASEHGSFYGGKNAIAAVKDTSLADYIPEEIAKNYTKIGTVRWLDIYVSDQVYFP